MNAQRFGALSSAGALLLLVACATSAEPRVNNPAATAATGPASSAAPAAPASAAALVVGNWRLVAVDTVLPDGSVSNAWMGKNPTGLIVYQPNGVMAVQIQRDPKPTFATGSRHTATPEELKGAYFGYYAYWGTYTLGPDGKTITHQLKASLLPEEAGVTYVRSFAVNGQRLVLTTPPYRLDGLELTNRLTWERWKD